MSWVAQALRFLEAAERGVVNFQPQHADYLEFAGLRIPKVT